MASSQQLILGEGAGGVVQYQISRSLRFNYTENAYLSRTPGSAGDQQKWTWSGWYKVSTLGLNQYGLFSTRDGVTNNRLSIGLQSDNTLIVYGVSGGVEVISLTTTQVFRDVSAWYHIVIALDTTQATAANRCKVYLNGSQITAFSTANYPTQNANLPINQTSEHNIGQYALTGNYIAGYLTEINFINGQALTPSSFGQTNSATGVWEPKAYSGSYGTNGFYLNFSDNSNTTSTTLGKDYSGNGNNWTPNNFSVTAGAGNDSLVDTPTPYGTDTGAGGEVRGNYCTLNPLSNLSSLTLANGNLDASRASASWASARATFGMSSGKWYWEITPITGTSPGSTANQIMIGISLASASSAAFYDSAGGWGYYFNDGNKWNNSSGAAYGASYTNNDVIGVAFDADAGTLTFYKNGVSQGTAYTGLTSGPYFPTHGHYGTSSSVANFGQRPFAYTAPSGFKALCTQNLPTPTIGATSATQAGKYFDISLYTGNGTSQLITNSGGFQPDLFWAKRRNAVASNVLFDAIRGANTSLTSNNTNAENPNWTGQSFGSNGFTVSAAYSGETNFNAGTFVAWQWNAGGSNATNTSGTITSTVRANTTAGFSIVTYTGTGANATVGHGLGATPGMIIIKNRDYGYNWAVWHTSLGGGDYALQLNTTIAKTNAYDYWNGDPTSTVFTLGTDAGSNQSLLLYVAYCFAPVAGYSAFGSYVGNNSADGPFIYTGFRPRYVLVKSSSAAVSDWVIYDTSRPTYNQSRQPLYANLSNAEPTAGLAIDLVSNGFKWREGGGEGNDNNVTFIYAAFAEFPFKYTLAR